MADRKSRRNRRILVLCAALVALAGAALAAKLALNARRQHQAAAALTRGMQAYDQQDYPRALPDLGRAAGRFRANPDLYYAVADTRRRIPEQNGRHIASAIAFARLGRDLAPDDIRHRILLIELYRSVGYVTEMIEEADKVLAADPVNAKAHAARIGALAALGRNPEALDAARTALALHPSDITFLQAQLEIMTASGSDPRDLQTQLLAHTQSFQNDPRFEVLSGRVARAAGDQPGALQYAALALALAPSDPDALRETITFCDQMAGADLSLLPQAAAAIDAAMSNPSLVPAIAAFVLERDWRLMQLETARTRAQALDPADPAIPDEALGWAALLSNAPASTRFEQALRARPTSAQRDAWIATIDAQAALSANHLADARSALDRVQTAEAAAQPANWICPPAHLAEARLLLAAGDPAAARGALRTLGRERDWLNARADLLLLLLNQNNIGEAMALLEFDPILASAQAIPGAVASSAATLIVSRQVSPEAAADMLEFIASVSAQRPDDHELAACHAASLLAMDRAVEAQAIMDRLDHNVLSGNARIMLAAASAPASRDAAPPDIERLLSNPPTQPDDLLRAALIVAAAREPAAGLQLFDAAIASALPPAQPPLRTARAIYLDRVADPSARQQLIELAEHNPESLPAQLAVLESTSAWTSPAGLELTIARLRALTGEDKASWRIHEARRLLAFNPSEASTAQALKRLQEARETSWPNPTISSLMADAALRDPTDPAARQRAVRHLVEGVQASADGATLYPRLVLLLKAAGDAAEADRQLDALLARQTIGLSLRSARADLAFLARRYEQALQDYRVLAQAGRSGARLGEANSLLALDRWNQAEPIYAELVAAADPAPAARLDYATALASRGQFERARAVLDELPDPVGDQPRSLIIADFYARHAPTPDAESHLSLLTESDNPDLAAGGAVRLVRFYLQQGRPADALAAADMLLARHPDDAPLREARALARMASSGQDAPSADDLAELALAARQRDPDSTYAHLTALMLERSRHAIDAPEYLRRLEALVQRDPIFMPTRAALVQALRADSRPLDAAIAATRASEAVPDSIEAAAMAARTLADAGEFVQAELYIARWKALLRVPSPEPDLLAAAIALDQGRPQQARLALAGWLDQLVSAARETGVHRPILAAVLALNGRPNDARGLFPDAPLGPADAPDYFAAGALLARADPDVAVDWELAARDLMVEPTDRLFMAGRLLTLGTDHAHQAALRASLELIDELEAANVVDAQLASMRASAQALLNEPDQAVLSYRRALERNPEDIMAMNNLAMLLARSSATAPEAVLLSRAALDRAEAIPNVPPAALANILDTCGLCLLAAGDPAAADAAFRRGLDLDPASIGCMVGTVEVLVARGDLESARAAMPGITSASSTLDAETRSRVAALRDSLE